MYTTDYLLIFFMIWLLFIVGGWIFMSWILGKILAKAGIALWKGFVPIYNAYLLLKLAFGHGWFILLAFIPVVNFVVAVLYAYKLSKAFNYGIIFTLGLLFLNPIFTIILALNSSTYSGPLTNSDNQQVYEF